MEPSSCHRQRSPTSLLLTSLPEGQFEEYGRDNHIGAMAWYDSSDRASPTARLTQSCDHFGCRVKDCSATRWPSSGLVQLAYSITPAEKASWNLFHYIDYIRIRFSLLAWIWKRFIIFFSLKQICVNSGLKVICGPRSFLNGGPKTREREKKSPLANIQGKYLTFIILVQQPRLMRPV